MTDINICSPTQEAQNEEITLCSSVQEEQGREINLCKPESTPAECTDPPELFLSGTDAPDVNDQYSASGGVLPYSYSFAGGTINSTGTVTAVTSCGGPAGNGAVGYVTVTDACGQTAQIEVRLPGGGFVKTSEESLTSTEITSCVGSGRGRNASCNTGYSYNGEGIAGGVRVVEQYQYLKSSLSSDCRRLGSLQSTGYLSCNPSCFGAPGFGSSFICGEEYSPLVIVRSYYEWRCP